MRQFFIFAIDDDKVEHLRIARLLRKFPNCFIYYVFSIEEAMKILDTFNPNLIICSAELEQQAANGIDLLKHIREKLNRQTPFILHTDYDEDRFEKELQNLNADYAYKDNGSLLPIIKKHLTLD